MLVADALSGYPDEDLERLARDKVEEVTNLRLPRGVLVQEIAFALSSLSYVAKVLAPSRPPTYAFLKLLLDTPDHQVSPQGFRERVLAKTDELTERAASGKGLRKDKNYSLYLRMLFAAWEDDGRVDRSEALLLGALRKELGLWMREHLLLEHDPLVRPVWDSDRAYEEARNHLLATGLVLVHDGCYALPDEVAVQIRRAWEIDLSDAAYSRLLGRLTTAQLRAALASASLPLSGSKEERIERIVKGLVPPTEILDSLHINEVKSVCRECSLPVTAAKAELIASLVEHFDVERDLIEETEEEEPAEPPAPEPRLLEPAELTSLLDELTVDLLYDILAARGLRRSGSKAERIERLVESPWSERTLLGDLRRTDLVGLCRQVGTPVSGVKHELIDRLVHRPLSPPPVAEDEHEVPPGASALRKAEPCLGTEVELAPPKAGTKPEAGPTGGLPEPPAGIGEMQGHFPGLEPDEYVILALLREARSLTEREIERASVRHGLGWFLTKAHMADLLARLRRQGASPIHLRSTGRLNIYEWRDGAGAEASQGLDRAAARDLVDALRGGVVPEAHLDMLAVGQDEVRVHLVELLRHVEAGRSAAKFIRGEYGAGKTFLCSWLKDRALASDFAASTVKIGPDQPLSDLPVFFSGLIDGLRTPEKRDASALADLLESWLLAVHRRTAQLEGVPAFAPGSRKRLAPLVEDHIGEELAKLSDVDPGFGPALRAFYQARLDGNHELAAAALAWLRGSQSVPPARLHKIGVRGHLTSDQVFPRMRALLEVIEGGRLRGLLLVLDELELVRRFPHARQRERAYETLRLLLDECGEHNLPGCLMVCTGTDQLFDDDRYGLPSYRALAHRVSPPQRAEGPASLRQPIISLSPLDQDRLLEMAVRVREIHGTAYDWPAAERAPRSVLERMVDRWTTFGDGNVERLPRPFLREVVNLLDLCEERPEIPAEEYLKSPSDEPELADSLLAILED